ncbi:hypothetical protein MUP77_05525 [Candidatus Bathyarchaeota archaeon]|nr:hypothetical protein [Candidatus Bathyarchaeota archaeon]
MRAYVFFQTRLGTSKYVIENLRKDHEQCFRWGSAVYGWYDAIVELEIPNTAKLTEIMTDLKHSSLDIVQIGTAVENDD